MEIVESAREDTNPRERPKGGRPRVLEVARRQTLQAQTISYYVHLIPIILESGLYLVVFVTIYKFLRENGWGTILSVLDDIFRITDAQNAIRMIWSTQIETAQLIFTGNVFPLIFQVRKQSIEIAKSTKEGREKWIKDQTFGLAKSMGYKGGPSIQDIFGWFAHDPELQKHQDWKAQFLAEINKLNKQALEEIKEIDYRMTPLEAAGWAALIVICLKSGLTIGERAASRLLGGVV